MGQGLCLGVAPVRAGAKTDSLTPSGGGQPGRGGDAGAGGGGLGKSPRGLVDRQSNLTSCHTVDRTGRWPLGALTSNCSVRDQTSVRPFDVSMSGSSPVISSWRVVVFEDMEHAEELVLKTRLRCSPRVQPDEGPPPAGYGSAVPNREVSRPE